MPAGSHPVKPLCADGWVSRAPFFSVLRMGVHSLWVCSCSCSSVILGGVSALACDIKHFWLLLSCFLSHTLHSNQDSECARLSVCGASLSPHAATQLLCRPHGSSPGVAPHPMESTRQPAYVRGAVTTTTHTSQTTVTRPLYASRLARSAAACLFPPCPACRPHVPPPHPTPPPGVNKFVRCLYPSPNTRFLASPWHSPIHDRRVCAANAGNTAPLLGDNNVVWVQEIQAGTIANTSSPHTHTPAHHTGLVSTTTNQ